MGLLLWVEMGYNDAWQLDCSLQSLKFVKVALSIACYNICDSVAATWIWGTVWCTESDIVSESLIRSYYQKSCRTRRFTHIPDTSDTTCRMLHNKIPFDTFGQGILIARNVFLLQEQCCLPSSVDWAIIIEKQRW